MQAFCRYRFVTTTKSSPDSARGLHVLACNLAGAEGETHTYFLLQLSERAPSGFGLMSSRPISLKANTDLASQLYLQLISLSASTALH